jgi:hypothetical protein
MPFTSIEGSLPLRLFVDAELFENLKDPRARDLGRSIARSYRLIKKLWWAMAVCVALLVIIRLLEQVADF